jgi:4-hydroxy-tetrahydrodipicolinate synthase
MFKGTITAIVTPFKDDGSLDLEALRNLVQFQLDNKVDGIVPCGTTGESPTLEGEEDVTVAKTVIDAVDGKAKVIAGAGSNNTKHAVELTKAMSNIGADGILQVNPYYNKPTQEGLYRHFSEVARATDKPIVLYNIKGRTAVNLETKTLARLQKEYSNIVAVKEASGDINQMQEVIDAMPKEFDVLSGDDNMTFELMKRGGKGVISVASNVIPGQVKQLTDYALAGDFESAENLNNKLLPFFEGMFIETNPIPVKTSLALMGKLNEVFRLPMCSMNPENKEKLRILLKNMKLV